LQQWDVDVAQPVMAQLWTRTRSTTRVWFNRLVWLSRVRVDSQNRSHRATVQVAAVADLCNDHDP
jgi:hypothetical protein